MTKAEKNKAYLKSHYKNNKQYYLDRNKIAVKEKSDYLIQLRTNTVCMDCKRNYPHYIMQFDHRDGRQKVNNVTGLVANSWKKLLAEIEKCDLVCANCHASRTYHRRIIHS